MDGCLLSPFNIIRKWVCGFPSPQGCNCSVNGVLAFLLCTAEGCKVCHGEKHGKANGVQWVSIYLNSHLLLLLSMNVDQVCHCECNTLLKCGTPGGRGKKFHSHCHGSVPSVKGFQMFIDFSPCAHLQVPTTGQFKAQMSVFDDSRRQPLRTA